MILSFNKCVKNALENGFYDAVMNSTFISNMYKCYQDTDDTIYASIILHKKMTNNKKNMCTLYNRVKLYYENDFVNEHNFTPIETAENNDIVFTQNGLKIYFTACYIYKSEEDFDLTMIYHKENIFIKNYLKQHGLSIIVYKLSFENIHSCNDDELIELFSCENKTKLSKKLNKKKIQREEVIIPSNTNDSVAREETILKIEYQKIEDQKIQDKGQETQTINYHSNEDDLEDGELRESEEDTSNENTSNGGWIEENDNKFKISFNKKSYFSHDDKMYIRSLIYKLYSKNEKFYLLMDSYNTICIVKNFHYDNEAILHTLHFNAYLYDNIDMKKTKIYHFYMQNNDIYRITELIDII